MSTNSENVVFVQQIFILHFSKKITIKDDVQRLQVHCTTKYFTIFKLKKIIIKCPNMLHTVIFTKTRRKEVE